MRILRSGCPLFILVAFWASGGHAAQAEGTPPYGIATVAPFKKAPVIDGKIEPGEWDGTALTLPLDSYGVRMVEMK